MKKIFIFLAGSTGNLGLIIAKIYPEHVSDIFFLVVFLVLLIGFVCGLCVGKMWIRDYFK